MSPTLTFRGQPYETRETTARFIQEALASTDISTLTVAVAWARLGGLVRLESEFATFRERGGHTRMILGIDEGIATKTSLDLATKIADEGFIFHDPSKRTFHPKIYLAEGSSEVRLLVGSSNLTAGGIYSNYEASLEARFALPDEVEDSALSGVRDYIESLIEEDQLCVSLDAENLERIYADPRYRIAEHEPNREDDSRSSGEQTNESGPALEPVFGRSRNSQVMAPRIAAVPSPDAIEGHSGHRSGSAKRPDSTADKNHLVVDSWSREIDATAAGRNDRPGSNPIGNTIRLGQKNRPDIDQTKWFRYEFFASAEWRSDQDINQNPIELADVEFLVVIDGEDQGTTTLVVDHAPHREAGQGNVTTLLRTAPLASIFREMDLRGYELKLSRRADGSYIFELTQGSTPA